ncbi:MAG: cyclopropane-fatty-acyl-phospholipid synthase family protein, partial [Hyphomicrobiales bacterium]
MAVGLKFLFDIIVRRGNLTVITVSGASLNFGDGTGTPVCIRLTSGSVERQLVLNPSLYLGVAYMDGGLVLESGTIHDLLEIFLVNLHRRWPASLKFLEYARTLVRRIHQFNPVSRSKSNIAHHYDLDGALYELFLDEDRHYSSAYYQTPEASLEDAQAAKLRHIAAKLDIRDGQRILDIGSGWGGLSLYLAGLADVTVTGLTLSEEQLELSRKRVDAAGMAEKINFRLEDYRQFDRENSSGKFDRIVSVGMFEHVGVSYFRQFFSMVDHNLTEDGVM